MILSSILTLLRINLSHFELFFIKQFITAIQSKIIQWWKLHNDQTGIKSLFKTNEKYRYGLQKTQSKHLKMLLMAKLKEFAWAKVLFIVLSSTFFSNFATTLVLCCLSTYGFLRQIGSDQTQWRIARSKFTSFFSAEVVACDV